MTNLPDYLPPMPAMYGIKQPSPEFGQGNDVEVSFGLSFNGTAITDVTGWKLTALVKKSLKAATVIYKTGLGENLRQNGQVFSLRIPPAVTGDMLAGTYHYEVVGEQQVGTGQPFDRRASLASGMFSLETVAGSPNPKLVASSVSGYIYDMASGAYVASSNQSENTEPNAVELL